MERKKFEPYSREQLVRDILRKGNAILNQRNITDPERLSAHEIRFLSAEVRGYTLRALAATRLDIREKNQALQAETIQAERKVKELVTQTEELKNTIAKKERDNLRAQTKIVDLMSKNGAELLADPFFNSRETAEFLGVKTNLLARMRKQNKGPRFHRITSYAIRYRLSSIEKYLDSVEGGPNDTK